MHAQEQLILVSPSYETPNIHSRVSALMTSDPTLTKPYSLMYKCQGQVQSLPSPCLITGIRFVSTH